MKIFASGNIPPRWQERFSAEFDFDIHDWSANQSLLPRDEFIKRMQGCQILITEFDEVDESVMQQLPDLIAIVDCRGNPVNIDIEAATRHNIVVMNTPGRNADAVADLTVALMVMVARGLLPAIQSMKRGEWAEQGFKAFYVNNFGHEVVNTTVGLVGLGAVARKVAKRLQGFDVNLIGYDPFVKQEQLDDLHITKVDLDTLLQTSDFVSLHAPVTPQTTGMIGSREFDLMKQTAYFVNTARAVLVDEQSLIDAVTTHKIAGAALDVFHHEPVSPDYVLLHQPNVVAIPHLGGATHEVTDHHSEIAYTSIHHFLQNDPINVVNPDAIKSAFARL